MAQSVTFDCNAGMERVFSAGKNISRDATYDVVFDIVNSTKPTEERYLSVIDRQSGNTALRVRLNDNGGKKPLNGLTAQYRPTSRPNPHLGVVIGDVDTERVFYAETNLSADASLTVILHITPGFDPEGDDKARYLTFHSNSMPQAFDDDDLDLNGDGGKKPLGGGSVDLRFTRPK